MKTLKLSVVLISLIAWLAGVADGQLKQKIDVTISTGGHAKVVYSRDTSGTFIYYKDVIDEIILENWDMVIKNDSMKQTIDILTKTLRIYVDGSIETNKAFLKFGLVDSVVIKRAMSADKEILRMSIDIKKRGGATSR